MSERITPRFSSPVRVRSYAQRVRAPLGFAPGSFSVMVPLGALVLAFYGCGSAGTTVGTGGSNGSGTGGDSTSSGGSSGPGSGGTTASGSGGTPQSSSGGTVGAGTGGDQGSGSGGTGTTGSGGGSASGGSTTSGSGGSSASSGGKGGTTVASGGSLGSGGAATGSGGAAMACNDPSGICHEFLANDNGKNQINYVNQFTGKGWVQPVGDTGANSPRTIEIVSNAAAAGGKAVLVSLEKGYGEFDLSNGKLLARVSNKAGVSGACRLPDGTTALGTDTAIIIVNASGAEMKRVALPTGDNLRAINRNPANGHYWFSKTSLVYEITDTGTISWMGDMGAGTKGYAVWWREGGGAYATTGDPSTVLEIDATGKILATIGGKTKFTSLGLDFFSGFVRLKNGNYVVANWLGHLSSPPANTAEVIEFPADGSAPKWKWGNQTLARQITNVYVFEN